MHYVLHNIVEGKETKSATLLISYLYYHVCAGYQHLDFIEIATVRAQTRSFIPLEGFNTNTIWPGTSILNVL